MLDYVGKISEKQTSKGHALNMIDVYTKDNCIQCEATLRFFKNRNIPFRVKDVAHDSSWKEYLPDALAAPVVVDHDTNRAWSGFRKDELDKCVS